MKAIVIASLIFFSLRAMSEVGQQAGSPCATINSSNSLSSPLIEPKAPETPKRPESEAGTI